MEGLGKRFNVEVPKEIFIKSYLASAAESLTGSASPESLKGIGQQMATGKLNWLVRAGKGIAEKIKSKSHPDPVKLQAEKVIQTLTVYLQKAEKQEAVNMPKEVLRKILSTLLSAEKYSKYGESEVKESLGIDIPENIANADTIEEPMFAGSTPPGTNK